MSDNFRKDVYDASSIAIVVLSIIYPQMTSFHYFQFFAVRDFASTVAASAIIKKQFYFCTSHEEGTE